jgi:hypothetical protein
MAATITYLDKNDQNPLLTARQANEIKAVVNANQTASDSAIAALQVTVQADDPTAASDPGWYAATGTGDLFFKSAAGLFTITGAYVAD